MRRHVEGYVDAQLRLGFTRTDEVIAGAINLFASDDGYPGDAFVEGTIRETLAALLREQETWARPTDAERLDRAFANLEESGILARHCYAGTRTWAAGDLDEEARIARPRGVPVRGRVFYTSQDADSLIEGELYLGWGAYLEGGLTYSREMRVADEVAENIVHALDEVGLDASWDGSGSTAIYVAGLEWRHPRDPATGEPLLSTEARFWLEDGDGDEATEVDRTPEADEATPRFRITAAGEWHVRIAYVSNESDIGPFSNLWYIHQRTDPEAAGDGRVGDEFSSEATYAFDFLPLALGAIGGRQTRFDLVAPPSSPFLAASRRNFVAGVDAVVVVPANEEALDLMLADLQESFGDARPITLIQLDSDRWSEEAMQRVEARLGDQVLRSNLRTGEHVFDVLKEAAKLTLTIVKRRVEG